MNCVFPALHKGAACSNCGYQLRSDYDSPPERDCPAFNDNPLPFGDWAEGVFSSFGVTKDRVSEALKAVGLPPCNCPERQEQWNEWGRKVSEWWRSS